MRSPEAGNVHPGLSPCGSERRVGMDNPSDRWKRLIQNKMCRCVGGRTERAFDYVPFEVHYDNIFGAHLLVGDSARLYGDETFFPVDAGNIAPCIDDKAVFDKVKIGLKYFLFKLLDCHFFRFFISRFQR